MQPCFNLGVHLSFDLILEAKIVRVFISRLIVATNYNKLATNSLIISFRNHKRPSCKKNEAFGELITAVKNRA